ncbi:hypothetical protein LX36DRAFT_270637 [Colletotrichum falcatum]|nr:hypothetical protein LX36DRAFT_270637 [Colletotrichum falcatum]
MIARPSKGTDTVLSSPSICQPPPPRSSLNRLTCRVGISHDPHPLIRTLLLGIGRVLRHGPSRINPPPLLPLCSLVPKSLSPKPLSDTLGTERVGGRVAWRRRRRRETSCHVSRTRFVLNRAPPPKRGDGFRPVTASRHGQTPSPYSALPAGRRKTHKSLGW